jgi:hypothetical protein
MNITGDMPLKSALDVAAWVVNQRIPINGNKSGTCSPIIRYIKRSRRDILCSIDSALGINSPVLLVNIICMVANLQPPI